MTKVLELLKWIFIAIAMLIGGGLIAFILFMLFDSFPYQATIIFIVAAIIYKLKECGSKDENQESL